MVRYIPLFLLLTFSVFGDFAEEDDEDEEYYETPNKISYAGMEIQCPWGCGFDEDPYILEISAILRETTDTVFCLSGPLRFTYNTPIYEPWVVEGAECTVYNWPATNGFSSLDRSEEIFSIATHSQFLETAAALRRDARFYLLDIYRQKLNLYKSILPRLNQEFDREQYGCVQFDEKGELEFFSWGTTGGQIQPIRAFTRDIKEDIETLEKDLSDFHPRWYEEKSEKIEEAIQKIDALYRDLFVWCLQNHQPEGIAFHGALEDFIAGDFDQAIEQIRSLLQIAEEQQLDNDFLSKLYLLKGQIQSEFSLYAEAIVDLTTAIQKNPSMKEAYFERAAAYFELGQFDEAIADYLVSGIRPAPLSHTQLGFGIGAGILEGAGVSLVEFIPSMLSTARGLGSGLWAFSKDPVSASQNFIKAAVQCVEYLKSRSAAEMVQDMVPELRELIQNCDELPDFQKGKLIGQVIGKYGVDIFCTKYALTAVKAYRDLKHANQLMTLEALASPQKTRTILAEAGKRWTAREQALRNGNLKFHEGRQGKHLENHPNYKQLRSDEKNPSIFVHSEPERLVRDHAGTGIKDAGGIPGTPGYQEIVNFEEFIGYKVDKKTGEKLATTWGKIHYAKDGIHIVPTAPRGN